MSIDSGTQGPPGRDQGQGQPVVSAGKRSGLMWLVLHFEEVFTALLLAVMLASVCVSVFYRYVLSQPLSWTEEVVLACMVWVVFIGASLATKTREHIVIDIVLLIVPRTIKRAMEVVALTVTIFVLAVLAWQGFVLLEKTSFMTTTALQMPTGIMYAAVPVSAVLMIIHNVQHLYRDLRGHNVGEVGDGVR